MFAANLNLEERTSIAKKLRGNTVIALAQDCARHGDLEGLEALRQAGHFDFALELAQKPSDTWKLQYVQQLNERALPMIDALVCAIESKEKVEESYPTPHAGERSVVHVTVTRLASNRPLWNFISHVCTRALDQFDEIFRSAPDSAAENVIGNNRVRTANVVAFLAAASDDAALYRRAQSVYSEAGRRLLDGPALEHVIGEHAALSKISPEGAAVAMGSLGVLNAHVGGAHVRHTMAKKRVGDSDVAVDLDYLLTASTGGGVPQPELVKWMLAASLDDEYEPTPTSKNAEKHETNKTLWALNLFGYKWSHCVEDVIEKHPSYVDQIRTQAFIFSVRAGLDDIATRLLDDWSGVKAGPVQEEGELLWGEHPVKSIIPSRTHPGHIGDIGTPDIDAAVVFMAKYMDERELLEPFVAGQAKFFADTALVHAIAQQNLNASLVYFADKGLDLEALSNGKSAAEIIEFVESTRTRSDDTSDNAETLRLLRALLARNAAEAALAAATDPHP